MWKLYTCSVMYILYLPILTVAIYTMYGSKPNFLRYVLKRWVEHVSYTWVVNLLAEHP